MSKSLQYWLIALAASGGFCAVSYFVFDRPIVRFLGVHIHDPAFFAHTGEVIIVPVPICAASVIWCGVAVLRERAVPRLGQCLAMAGFAVTWAAAVNDLMLKPLFGRFDIDAYYNRHYGFRLLQGATQSSFPSGHAAVLMSLLSVAWIAYPRFRPVYGAIAALLLPCLMAAGWHFLSDVVAGAFVGMTAGLMTVTLWGNLWRHPISPPIAF